LAEVENPPSSHPNNIEFDSKQPWSGIFSWYLIFGQLGECESRIQNLYHQFTLWKGTHEKEEKSPLIFFSTDGMTKILRIGVTGND
jgi:hypothetical protein